MRAIPILWQHDPARVVGRARQEGKKVILEFTPRTVTPEMMFNAGWRPLEQEAHDGKMYITRAELVELSVGPE